MSLIDLIHKYHQKVQFLMIYIREAHAVDGWWLGGGLTGFLMRLYRSRAATDVYDPQTLEERRQVAGRCEATLKYGVRTYVDDMDDAVSKAYAAAPTRLYFIDLDGQVAYAGGLGPFGFKPPELGRFLEEYFKDRQV